MKEIALSFLAGILTSLSPCILPLLPIVVGSALQQNALGPVALAFGLTLSFASIGLLFVAAGSVLGLSLSAFNILAAVLLIFAGTALLISSLQERLSIVISPLSTKAEGTLQKIAPTGLLGQFVVGLLLGAIWSPCTGPTLGGAIALASSEGASLRAALIMFSFGAGASLPLLLVGYGARRLVVGQRKELGAFAAISKKILGVVLLIIGVLILTGYDKKLESFVLDHLPQSFTNVSVRY